MRKGVRSESLEMCRVQQYKPKRLRNGSPRKLVVPKIKRNRIENFFHENISLKINRGGGAFEILSKFLLFFTMKTFQISVNIFKLQQGTNFSVKNTFSNIWNIFRPEVFLLMFLKGAVDKISSYPCTSIQWLLPIPWSGMSPILLFCIGDFLYS